MKSFYKRFIIIGLWMVIGIFSLRCAISKPTGLYGIFSCTGESVVVALVLMGIYERYLWRFAPFRQVPCIEGRYLGTIEYAWNNESKEKQVDVVITQSFLSVNVKVTTSEVTSNVVVSRLIEENGEYVLYYTYITNPRSKVSKGNPMQYGTCRLVINSKSELQGKYWTSRQTIGDIMLNKYDG